MALNQIKHLRGFAIKVMQPFEPSVGSVDNLKGSKGLHEETDRQRGESGTGGVQFP